MLAKSITNLYDPIYSQSTNIILNSKRRLAQNGISMEDLKELENQGIQELTVAKRQAFSAKDYEINQSTKMLSKRRDISYGVYSSHMKSTNGNTVYDYEGNPKEENSLIIDVPYYGQFLIHIKDKSSVSNFDQIPFYSKKYMYEKENVLLTDQLSESAQKIFDKTKPATYKKLKGYLKGLEKTNARYAHYLAIKLGATKRELRDLHNSNER